MLRAGGGAFTAADAALIINNGVGLEQAVDAAAEEIPRDLDQVFVGGVGQCKVGGEGIRRDADGVNVAAKAAGGGAAHRFNSSLPPDQTLGESVGGEGIPREQERPQLARHARSGTVALHRHDAVRYRDHLSAAA